MWWGGMYIIYMYMCLMSCVPWLPRGRPSFTYTAMNISLSVAPPLMERNYQSIPSGILMAHTE